MANYASVRERSNLGRFIVPSYPSGFDRKEYKKRYYELHKKEILEKSLEWSRNNKNRRKKIKKRWDEKNKERKAFLRRRYYHLKKNAVGSYSLEEERELHRKHNYLCFYCKKDRATSLDHVIPLSRGGTNFITNLVPACVPCNSKKGSKILS